MAQQQKVISVYGSAAADPRSPEYADGVDIGRALAAAGFAVMTGGYDGMMGAVSRGAYEMDGHVIGVTTEALRKVRPNLQPNPWVKEEVGYLTLHERLFHLVTRADGYVVLPGGLGTFTELMLVWELMRVGDIPRSPIVLYGDYWLNALSAFKTAPYAQRDSWNLLHTAHTPQQVVAIFQTPPSADSADLYASKG